ncbi:hypothetical protein [Faecalicatena contorta]|uniref:Uncharacterized protein n=1 Tax=Faecalicatena contorta TaxID=39482 RepID=A0A315ZUS0_9FIRM|nr:hypothetical protein [Faecalicatena contorta]PWJ49326.1 hypothetical protein A8805_10722 [Faecalicatena contorta]SUQ14570.1 hypothetical protein SAMN05216529_10722 [Faecalicatena contorta]
MEGKTFEQRIAELVEEKLNSGMVEEIIEEKLRVGVSSAVEELFTWRGDGKKAIEEKMKEIMVPVIERHDFNQYIVKLDSVLTELVNSTNLADNKIILENFKELMKEPEQKEIKLSEIFERYCKRVAAEVDTSNLEAECEDGEPYYSHVTANMEVEHEDKRWFKSSSDNCIVRFTCEEDEGLNCQIKLYRFNHEKNWKILSGIGDIEINSLRHASNFEVFLLVLKRSFTEIILDTESECDDDIEPDEKPEWSLD